MYCTSYRSGGRLSAFRTDLSGRPRSSSKPQRSTPVGELTTNTKIGRSLCRLMAAVSSLTALPVVTSCLDARGQPHRVGQVHDGAAGAARGDPATLASRCAPLGASKCPPSRCVDTCGNAASLRRMATDRTARVELRALRYPEVGLPDRDPCARRQSAPR